MRVRTITSSLGALALLLAANSALGAIAGLHNTGEAGIGVIDAFYNGPPVDTGPDGPATAIGVAPALPYVSTGLAAGSHWISFAIGSDDLPLTAPSGFYNYYYSTPDWSAFSNIEIQFDMASDNSVRVFLNGSLTPVVQLISLGPGDESTFNSLHHFVINTGLLSGVNNFRFQTENFAINTYNPQALLVTNIEGTGIERLAELPEPATFAAWSVWSGLGLLIGGWRRQRFAARKPR